MFECAPIGDQWRALIGERRLFLMAALPTPPEQTDTLPQGEQEPERYRFQVELEFVQCLANPQYLNFLAQHGYFKEKEFVNYLSYLQYWKEQKYAQFLKYPHCLHFLDLLQSEHFRRELANSQCATFIENQQILHWHFYTKKRMQFQEKLSSQSKVPAVPTSTNSHPQQK